MNKKSPNVIFTCKYLLALNNQDNKNKGNTYVCDRKKDVNKMVGYFSDNKKKMIGMFEYYMGHTRNENVNLVLENGNYATDDDVERLKKSYEKYIENSNLWKGVISFNNDYINNNIQIKDLEKLLAKEILPQFFKYCGFKDHKNMSYIFATHTNTKHIHIHLAFVEKKPNYKCCNNIISYRKKGKISVDEQRYLKRLIELTIEREKVYTPLITEINNDIDNLKKYFSPQEKNFLLNDIENIELEEKILKLGELITNYRSTNNNGNTRIKYNSIKNNELGKEIKKITKDIKKSLFSNKDSLLFNCYKEFNKKIDKLNNYFTQLNEGNNIYEVVSNNSIVLTKEKYLENYIYNSIVNHALFQYKKNSSLSKKKSTITINDLILEIVGCRNVLEYNLSEKQKRKIILNNCFNGIDLVKKFPNKYQIERALKNIDEEMLEAQKEFSKLFQSLDNNVYREF